MWHTKSIVVFPSSGIIHNFGISFKFPSLAFFSLFRCAFVYLFIHSTFFSICTCVFGSVSSILFLSQANRVKWSLTSESCAFLLNLHFTSRCRCSRTFSVPLSPINKLCKCFAVAAAADAAMHPNSANNTLEAALFQDYRYHFNRYIFTLAICVPTKPPPEIVIKRKQILSNFICSSIWMQIHNCCMVYLNASLRNTRWFFCLFFFYSCWVVALLLDIKQHTTYIPSNLSILINAFKSIARRIFGYVRLLFLSIEPHPTDEMCLNLLHD